MVKRYRVAGHVLELEMPECRLWERLVNYRPFDVTDTPEGQDEPAFSLKVIGFQDGPEYPDGKTPVLVGSAEKGAPRLDLYMCGEDWWVEMAPLDDMEPTGWLRISGDLRHGTVQVREDSDTGRFAVDNSMMLMFAFRTSTLRTLEMHSSVVMKNGRGYLFLGKSGTGKSTHSRMWLENLEGVRLLNDDNPIIRIGDDGQAIVYGSPWSGKTPCYRNESAPIGAIVLIRRCKENKLTRLGIPESYAIILSSSSGLRAVPAMADGLHESIADLIMSVPCYVLDCLPDGDAAHVCWNGVNGEA